MEAKRDENRIPTLTGISSLDELTIALVYADPNSHRMKILDCTGGTFSSTRSSAKKDENRIPVLMAVSSADGKTPIPVYIDGNNFLLTKSS